MNIELINKYKFIEQKLAEWIRIMLILIVNINVQLEEKLSKNWILLCIGCYTWGLNRA